MSRIVFGTSGWRGILCEDFVFENVKVVTQAIADHILAGQDKDKGIIVGYDSRFMGDRFAKESARVLTGAGLKTFICKRDTPTPVIAFEILRRNAAGGIKIYFLFQILQVDLSWVNLLQHPGADCSIQMHLLITY